MIIINFIVSVCKDCVNRQLSHVKYIYRFPQQTDARHYLRSGKLTYICTQLSANSLRACSG